MLDRVADLVAKRLRVSGETSDGYYTTKSNPLGSARAFRDAAHDGRFPSFKLGRLIAAKKTDVHAWIESRTVRLPVAARARPKTADDALLDEFGLQATRLGATRAKGQG